MNGANLPGARQFVEKHSATNTTILLEVNAANPVI